MFISIVTSLALILQIGAFAVHFHPKHHEHEQLSLDIKQVQKAHHCDLCDAIIQICVNDDNRNINCQCLHSIALYRLSIPILFKLLLRKSIFSRSTLSVIHM